MQAIQCEKKYCIELQPPGALSSVNTNRPIGPLLAGNNTSPHLDMYKRNKTKHTHTLQFSLVAVGLCLTLSNVMLTVWVQTSKNLTMLVGEVLQGKTGNVRGRFVKTNHPTAAFRDNRLFIQQAT